MGDGFARLHGWRIFFSLSAAPLSPRPFVFLAWAGSAACVVRSGARTWAQAPVLYSSFGPIALAVLCVRVCCARARVARACVCLLGLSLVLESGQPESLGRLGV